MTSTSLITIIIVILAAILVDVFCGDVTNSRQTNLGRNTQHVDQKSPDIGLNTNNTTPWPTLGQRFTTTSNSNNNARTRPTTQSPKKWIQQNNIWIRNEQGNSGGNAGGTPTNNQANQNRQGVRGNVQNSGTTSTTSPLNSWIRNEQANSGGNSEQGVRGTGQQHRVRGNTQNSGSTNVAPTKPALTISSTKRPLIRGDTYTVLKPQVPQDNRQQALIDGLSGNKQNVDPASSSTPKSTAPTNKPMSYAGVVGPKTPPISPPSSPQIGGPKKDTLPSAGPVHDNVEDFEGQSGGNAAANTDSSVTDDELREFSETLLRKDSNNAMKYVTLNLQGMTSSRSSNDEAPLPLLKIEEAAYKIPSIEKIVLLYNNYFLEASQNEVYTGQERIEENNLLDTILATPVMQFARSFLIQKEKIGRDPKEFKDLLRLIWFNMYSRGGGRIGSSGFEHVFVSELKNHQVSGLHNWIYFNEEESLKRANYLGYLKKLDLGEKGAILKLHFTFHDIDKPVGSMFIGTSPELEMALYTTCFLLRADRICPLKMNGNRFIIRTYTYRYRGKNMIGSAFPEI